MVLGKQKDVPANFYAQAPAPAAPGPNVSSVQHNLDVRIATLTEKIKKCDMELIRQKQELKQCKKDSSQYNMAKQRASRMLKQKRTLEMQLDQTFKQQVNVDAVSMAVEQMKEAKDTISIMESTNKQLAKEIKKVDLDKAENLQDDLEDILNQTNYISETLGRDYTVDGVNEEDLEAELDGIEEDLFLNTGTEVPMTKAVPGQYAGVPVPQAGYSEQMPDAASAYKNTGQ
ncbi:hypothetical protein NDN08_003397 [Rhodosorus marinus]|uniref:Charged multivesicular body protein 5 n=1 Tax=Rhodosorus marinus TaxID=101924 RepID=A0AAV8UZ81_9RHOD|nr:hypothetical protein NDN08_003397 [Rhodosorus marinus]